MRDDDRDVAPRARTIGFQVPADLDQLTMAHALAETVLLLGGFALDEVTDLLLAVDEVVTALVLVATPDTVIDAALTGSTGALGARFSTVAEKPEAIDETAFGWHVIATLTDTLSVGYGDFDADRGGYPTSIAFGWIRRGPIR